MDPLSAIGLGVSFVSSVFGGIGAGKAKRAARRREKAAAANLMALEANRADIPDFAGDLANPYANLQVATQASEMQAEQQDISLASTLDTLRATGAGAGGATALARAASQSKRGVSAQIEKQEARNAQLRAQGEMQTAQMRQRGEMANFQAITARENQQLNRQASIQSSASQQAAAYGGQQSAMLGQAIGAVGSFAAAGGFGTGKDSSGVRNISGKEIKQTEKFNNSINADINNFDQSSLDSAMNDINQFEYGQEDASIQRSINAMQQPNFGNLQNPLTGGFGGNFNPIPGFNQDYMSSFTNFRLPRY